MGLVTTKPVFGVSDIVRFKPACSATGTSKKIEISLVASFDMVLSKHHITKALISLRGCAGWSAPLLFANSWRQVFSRPGPIGFTDNNCDDSCGSKVWFSYVSAQTPNLSDHCTHNICFGWKIRFFLTYSVVPLLYPFFLPLFSLEKRVY